jgi:hypothetical protein
MSTRIGTHKKLNLPPKMHDVQIIEHLSAPVAYSPFGVRWTPGSTRAVVFGECPRGTGTIDTLELTRTSLDRISAISTESGVKCGVITDDGTHSLCTGEFSGTVATYDLSTSVRGLFSSIPTPLSRSRTGRSRRGIQLLLDQ